MIGLDVYPPTLPGLVIAAFVGALVSYERERKGRPAGVRTHGMV